MMRSSLAVVSLSLLLAAGCSSSTNEKPSSDSQKVTLNESSILGPSSLNAGKVTFAASNLGQQEHEMVIFQTDLNPADLPVEGDKVNEEAAGLSSIGEIEGVQPGKTKSSSFTMKQGRYVLICNKPGHYKAGMYLGLTVN